MNKPIQIIIARANQLTTISRQQSHYFQQLALQHLIPGRIPIQISRSPGKKPELVSHPNHFFSVSHTTNCICLCLATTPIGCDIESLNRPISDTVINRNQPKLISYSNQQKVILWTQWEAQCKLMYSGLRFPVSQTPLVPCETIQWQDLSLSVASQTSPVEWEIFEQSLPDKTEQWFDGTEPMLQVVDAQRLTDEPVQS